MSPFSRTPLDGPAPALISLPLGLLVSGITTWAFRLADGLATHGRRVVIVAHPEPSGFAPLTHDLPPSIELIRTPTDWPALEGSGSAARYIHFYRDIIRRLVSDTARPVVCLPNLSAASYGLFASLALTDPESVRIIPWTHNHVEHDLRLCDYFEPCLTTIVGVSQAIAADLAARLPWRRQDIEHVAHGVRAPSQLPARGGLRGRALKLIYTGRMDDSQKRVSSLIELSDELLRRNLAHELTLVGDGPIASHIDRHLETRPSIRRMVPDSGGQSHEAQIAQLLRESDLFVLPSRYEGLSVSMLEAMGQGCVPVVTDVSSGAREAVEPERSGLLVNIASDASHTDVARAFADAIERAMKIGLGTLAQAAWRTVRDRYSLERTIARSRALIDAAADSPPRSWPANRACIPAAAVDANARTFSVPSDAPDRALRALSTLGGRRVALWGAGRHTIALAQVLADSPAHIVCIIEDDPSRQGGSLWGYPIVAPNQVDEFQVEVVLISSWMHEQSMWARRDVFTSRGITVRALYAVTETDQSLANLSHVRKNEAGREIVPSGGVTIPSRSQSLTRVPSGS